MSDKDVLIGKGLVTLTKHEQVRSGLIKVENWDSKDYCRHTQPKQILLCNKTSYFTSNFDFD